jgi:protein-tyrosine phosphatase
LPGLDDGALAPEVALRMAQMAAADGIGTIIATPHWPTSGVRLSPEQIAARVATLQQAVDEAGIKLRLMPGAELALTPAVLQAEEGTLPTLAGSRYVLAEVLPYSDWTLCKGLIFELQVRGYKVVLAHAERATPLVEEPERAEQLVAGGTLLQVTVGGLLGQISMSAKGLARRLVKAGLVAMVATDAHDLRKSPPKLTPARKIVTKLGGQGAFERLTVNGPREILGA